MNTETIEQVTPVETPVAQVTNQFQPIFDALVKALMPSIIEAIKENDELDSYFRELASEEADDRTDQWFSHNFDIWEYSDSIEEMVTEDRVKEILRGLDFSVSVE